MNKINHTERRRRLPTDRYGVTRKSGHCRFKYYITVNFFDDLTPAEVFIKISKEGSTVSGFIKIVCIMMSIANDINIIVQQVQHEKLDGNTQAHSDVDENGGL